METLLGKLILEIAGALLGGGVLGFIAYLAIKAWWTRVSAEIHDTKREVDRVGKEVTDHKLYAADMYVKHPDCHDFRKQRDIVGGR